MDFDVLPTIEPQIPAQILHNFGVFGIIIFSKKQGIFELSCLHLQ